MNRSNIYVGILGVVMGLFFLVAPMQSAKVIIILMGAFSIVTGIYHLVRVLPLSQDDTYRKTVLIRSWLNIGIGLLAVIMPIVLFSAAEKILKVLLIIYAVFLFLSGLSEIILILKLKGTDSPIRNFRLESIITCVVAVVLLMLIPQQNILQIILRVIGALLAIACGIYLFFAIKNKPIEVEAEEVTAEAEETQE